MNPTEILTTSKGERVAVLMSDGAAAQLILARATSGGRVSSFALDLAVKSTRRPLTPAQRPWLHKLANEIATPPAPAAPAADAVNLRPLADMMAHAAKSLRHPRVLVSLPVAENLTRLQLSVAGPSSRNPGTVNVTDGGAFGSNVWYGRINRDGAFDASRSATPEVVTALKLWATDPAGVARAHGHRTASCCFCRRHLETDESLAVGYGPVCAEKFGLPWGGKRTAAEVAADSSPELVEEVAA